MGSMLRCGMPHARSMPECVLHAASGRSAAHMARCTLLVSACTHNPGSDSGWANASLHAAYPRLWALSVAKCDCAPPPCHCMLFASCRGLSCALWVEDAAEEQADAPRQRLDEFVARRTPVPLAPLARHRLARRLPHQCCLRAARRASCVACHARARSRPPVRTRTCMKASSACVSDSLLPQRLRSRCDSSLKKSFTFSPDLSCTCVRAIVRRRCAP